MTVQWLQRSAGARTLVLSLRRALNSPSRASNVELEDLLLRLDRVDLLELRGPPAPPLWQRIVGRVGRASPATWPYLAPAHTPPPGEWELLFLTCQSPTDLYMLGSLRPWRERCRVCVVWIDELWAHTVPDRPLEMELLSEFDHVWLGCHGSIPAVKRATGRPVSYGAPAVDALRFCPWPDPPTRWIDVYNMGRRSAVTHQALLELAARRGLFYLHDSLTGPELRVHDMREHRTLLMRLLQRTRFFVTNRAKLDVPGETQAQEEVGFRFFEGAAGGAVLIGDPPRCHTFHSHFGWEDAVIPLPLDARQEAGQVLAAIASDPAREETIRRRNVANVLARHDWAHRWNDVLKVAGLAPLPALEERHTRLRERAAELLPGAAKARGTVLTGTEG